MAVTAYYNEFDPYAAQWLRNLIAEGLIADGHVDERSIVEVSADDLAGYRQCHYFAGIGGWSLALRLAGWPDDKPVWTGSCPCQPFSAAGKRKGAADERHLWPEFHRLIAECRPASVFGEQVASRDGRDWLAAVRADLEALGYAVGAADLCAAGVGAPHIRQRLWFVGMADANDAGLEGRQPLRQRADQCVAWQGGMAGGMADTYCGVSGQRGALYGGRDSGGDALQGARPGRGGLPVRMADADGEQHDGAGHERENRRHEPANRSDLGRLADAERERIRPSELRGAGSTPSSLQGIDGQRQRLRADAGAGDDGLSARPDAIHGGWTAADWLYCRDGKWRPVEPGASPLADGLPACLAELRAIEERTEAEVAAYAGKSQRDPGEVLRMVRSLVRAEARWQEQPARMRLQLPAPEVLLDFLLCVEAAREAKDGRGVQKALNEAQLRVVRSVREFERNGCASRRREPAEQLIREPSDTLLALSFVLARHAQAYRKTARAAHAADSRVTMLRGYGNAIVPAVAAQFIGAVMECQP